jgi:hypothetical protein
VASIRRSDQKNGKNASFFLFLVAITFLRARGAAYFVSRHRGTVLQALNCCVPLQTSVSSGDKSFEYLRLGRKHANYINALAVSISPIFEPAGPTLGELFVSPWVNFFMTLGELFKSGHC